MAREPVEQLKQILTVIGNTRFARRKREDDIKIAFLSRVTEDGWGRLIRLAEDASRADRPITHPMDPSTLAGMIGSSRQIVITEPEQFHQLRNFLDHFAIDDSCITVVYGNHAYPPDLALAREIGFMLKRADDMTIAKTPLQLDVTSAGIRALDPGTGVSLKTRYALVIKRCQNGQVRNRLELVVLAAAYSTSKSTTS
jgi:hypothetical protein